MNSKKTEKGSQRERELEMDVSNIAAAIKLLKYPDRSACVCISLPDDQELRIRVGNNEHLEAALYSHFKDVCREIVEAKS